MAVDAGQATGSAELFLGNPPTAGIEVHVGNPPSNGGVNPLSPLETANSVDPSVATTLATQKSFNLNLGGAGIRFLNPA